MFKLNAEVRSKHDWLKLEKHADSCFRGFCDPQSPPFNAYGGQLMAQALAAAYATVDSAFLLAGFHCYFIRGVKDSEPIYYDVRILRMGRNFSVLRAEATQFEEICLSVDFQFQRFGNASKRSWSPPQFPQNIPPPEELHSLNDKHIKAIADKFPAVFLLSTGTTEFAKLLEIRPCDPQVFITGVPSERFVNEIREGHANATNDSSSRKQFMWIKYKPHVEPKQMAMAHCALTYLSDYSVTNTGLFAHPVPTATKLKVSLDHSLWIHKYDFYVNDWILYEQELIAHAYNRSLVLGKLWTRRGQLLATVAQDTLSYVDANVMNGSGESRELIENFHTAMIKHKAKL